ncbi:hypothetical protein FACS1894120_3700 [Clostridia bacterium]|nr:hypothetical protein FACS1894120_3700 [Clostridia bacterium]
MLLKRILAMTLAVTIAVTMLAFPASAATARFLVTYTGGSAYTDDLTLDNFLLNYGLAEGTVGDYGLMITSILGETADYSVDKSYWCYFYNGEYSTVGTSGTVMKVGDRYEFQKVYDGDSWTTPALTNPKLTLTVSEAPANVETTAAGSGSSSSGSKEPTQEEVVVSSNSRYHAYPVRNADLDKSIDKFHIARFTNVSVITAAQLNTLRGKGVTKAQFDLVTPEGQLEFRYILSLNQVFRFAFRTGTSAEVSADKKSVRIITANTVYDKDNIVDLQIFCPGFVDTQPPALTVTFRSFTDKLKTGTVKVSYKTSNKFVRIVTPATGYITVSADESVSKDSKGNYLADAA